MPEEKRISKILRVANSAEEQAIAIYEAEMFWRPEKIFAEILAEERDHLRSISFEANGLFSISNRLAGWVLGSALSILPRSICYRVHIWAELEAAKVYENAHKALKALDLSAEQQKLLPALLAAQCQEEEHSLRFQNHLKNIFPDAPFKSKKPL